MRHLILTAVLMSCATLSGAAEAVTGPRTIALRQGPLPWDNQALTPSAVKKTEGRRDLPGKSMVISAKNGLVEPSDHMVINKESSITIAGTQVLFTQQGGVVSYALPGGRPIKLKSRGDGLDAIHFPPTSTMDPLKRPISVAFPIAVVQTNNTNQTSTVRLYYRFLGAWMGQLGGDVISLVDDELDGVCVTGKDAVSVNSGIVFAPLGQWLPTSTALYEVTEVDKSWAKLVCAPSSEPTVRLSLAAQGIASEVHAVFSGKDIHAVVTSRKPVTTKAGAYKLAYALIADPARRTTIAGILPGKSKEFDAAAPISIGAPFRLEFTATVVNKQLGIDPNSLRLYGRSDEQYVCFRISGQPTVGLNGKPFGSMQVDRNRGTPNEFTQPLPNRIPAGEATITMDLIIEGLGKVQGTAKVSI